jgi:hypothetical protein
LPRRFDGLPHWTQLPMLWPIQQLTLGLKTRLFMLRLQQLLTPEAALWK